MNNNRRNLITGATTTIENAIDAWETAFQDVKEGEPTPEQIKTAWENFTSELQTAQGDLETARDEEQEYFDNMPVGFQQGSKGDDAQENIDNLETALSALESAIESIVEDVESRLTYLQDSLDAAGEATA